MWEILLVLSLLTCIGGLTALLRLMAMHLHTSSMLPASSGAPIAAEFTMQNVLETYFSYRG